ncbi:hypothetical protein BDZ97DRAFT_164729 [Flammula alnicola]|nr:hypothetical protein BDZ97DRAFT_164729 [Flammula alnicola]
MLSVEPKLILYDEFWPLQEYYDSYSRKFRSRRNSNEAKAKGRNMIHSQYKVFDVYMSSRENTPSENSDSEYRETPQPDASFESSIKPSTGSRPVQSAPTIKPLKSQSSSIIRHTATYAPESKSSAYYGRQAISDGPLVPSTSFAPKSSRSTARHTDVFTSANVSQELVSTQHGQADMQVCGKAVVVTASCFLCDPTTEIDPLLNNKLRQLMGDISILKALASVGIYFDQHLDIILRLDHATRMEFIQLIPPHQLTALAKFKLLKLFNETSLNKPQSSEMNPGTVCIPCPTHAVEEQVANPDNRKYIIPFRRAMKLDDDNDLFNDVLDSMEKRSREYFFTYMPCVEQLQNVIRRVSVKIHL